MGDFVNYLIRLIIPIVAVLCIGSSANASVTKLTDENTYNGATIGTTSTTFVGITTYGNKVWDLPNSLGTVQGDPYAINIKDTPFYQWPSTYTKVAANISGHADTITLSFQKDLYGFALNLGTLYNWAGGTTIEFEILGKTFMATPEITSSGGKPSFLGFISDEKFRTVTIKDNTGGNRIR